MKNLVLLLLSLTVSAAFAADTKPIEGTFQTYWKAYVQKDFAQAAAEVLPADLEAAKAELLPVFLAAQNNTNKPAQEMVAAFFGKVVGKSRETMSAAEVYAGLNRLISASNPQFFELLKVADTTIVFVRTMDAENAEVHFQVIHRGASDMDVETLTKKSGRWWVRINEDPKQVAAELKAMLARQA